MTIDIVETGSTAIDSDRWPDVARVPRGHVSAMIAGRLIRSAAARLPLRLAYPDGTVVGAADATLPTMVIHRPEEFARRLGRYGLIGFGESYMAGEWSCDDLVGLINEFAKSATDLIPPALQRLRSLAVVRPPRSQHQSRAQARRNIAEHYDLSNDLFAEFLDETMTYSSALFGTRPASPADLPDAQRRKIDRLLDTARVGPGSRVLEIGTGWGELCLRAAARGAHVHSITLSAEQQHLARNRVAAAGLSDRVDIELCDYRDVYGRYDAVRNTYTWIQKYIFPGGMLPSTEAILGITERHTRLRTVDMFSLRPHYAETLRLWRERFIERRDAVAALGFDKVFQRMWQLYLAYSEAGFSSGYLDVYQWTFAPTGSGSMTPTAGGGQ